jgi:hypothetical protein
VSLGLAGVRAPFLLPHLVLCQWIESLIGQGPSNRWSFLGVNVGVGRRSALPFSGGGEVVSLSGWLLCCLGPRSLKYGDSAA